MIFTLRELLDAVLMVAVIGFIFKDYFKIRRFNREGIPIENKQRFKPFLMAIAVTAPAIIIHELGHKLVAMSYGLQATFHAHYPGLGIGLALKLIGSPFLFFIPAFVQTSGTISGIPTALIAFAGPAVNLVLWLVSKIVLAKAKNLSKEWKIFLLLTRKINGFLFIINMIPIPGFDGFKVFTSIAEVIM